MSATIPAILQQTKLPDLVAAVYGDGRTEVRVRGSNNVVMEATDTGTVISLLKKMFSEGFSLDIRYDPHM